MTQFVQHTDTIMKGTVRSPHDAGTENLINSLIMSFVERRVSPQTIADVVRAQISETGLAPGHISTATCNGIIEVLAAATSVGDCTDILLFLGRHPGFPDALSVRAAFAGLLHCLARASVLLASPEAPKRREALRLVELFAKRAKSLLLRTQAQELQTERLRLIEAFKGADSGLNRLFAASFELASLRDTVFSVPRPEAVRGDRVSSISTPRPHHEAEIPNDMHTAKATPTLARSHTAHISGASDIRTLLDEICRTPDHVLALKGTQPYLPVAKNDKGALPPCKTNHLDLLLSRLGDTVLTPFQCGFLAEWFFEGELSAILQDPGRESLLINALARTMQQCDGNMGVLKGILRGLQKDLCRAVASAEASGTPPSAHAPHIRLSNLAQAFFPNLVSAMEAHGSTIAKHFAPWAVQMSVQPEQARLFTRTHWQWVRVLATQRFEEDLRAAPAWVVRQANRTAARLFQIAPGFWLHDHAAPLIERLHQESQSPSFVRTTQHYDFVEFILRTARKKSPLIASRPESLFALRLLGRIQPSEEQHLGLAETRTRMDRRHHSQSVAHPTAHSTARTTGTFLQDLMDMPRDTVEGDTSGNVVRALAILARILRETRQTTQPTAR